ncbi:hypothetical protein PO124_31475 [Bacillus licheniformis]|nr:hypothetical protein [Bacillus licheniformis]
MPNVAAAGYHHHPYPYPFYPGGCWIPVSPVLPGSGFAILGIHILLKCLICISLAMYLLLNMTMMTTWGMTMPVITDTIISR